MLGLDKEGRAYIIEQAQNKSLSVRTKDWKYIEPCDGPKMIPWGPKVETGYLPHPQLFDMNNDRKEQTNLADQHPKKVYELQEILRKLRKK